MRLRPSSLPPLPPEVEDWLAGLPEQARNELLATWALADTDGSPFSAIPPPDSTRRDATWAFLAAATRRRARNRVPLFALRAPTWRLARISLPAALMLFALGLALWLRPTTLVAPLGETYAATLPDGSHIELNSGSALLYRRDFGTTARRVTLRGEAFFDVVPGVQPFIVETFNARIEAIGTRFNVRAWENEFASETTLEVSSGTVRFTPRASGAAVLLAPGQASRLTGDDPSPTAPNRIDPAQKTAWWQGGFFFANEPLGLIFDEIERRFAVDIQATAAIRRQRFTLFRHHVANAENVLNDICQANALRFRATANGFEVYQE